VTARLAGIGVPDAPAAWEAIGCTVVDDAIPFANGALLLGCDGIFVAETNDPVPSSRELRTGSHAIVPAVEHSSGAFELDHLVLLTNSLERTSQAVHDTFGLERRRLRDDGAVRQAFHRFADPPGGGGRGCIVEVVESDRVAETTMMGVVINVADLFELADRLGPDVMSLPKPAVQPGRHISTVRRDVGLGTAVALMTP
jgi:hypothetical protein